MRFPPTRTPLGRPVASRLMLVAVHLPAVAQAPLYAVNGSLGGIPASGHVQLAILSAVVILALQLRHSFALARGERPRAGVWTLLALAAAVYLPLHWLGLNWISEQMVLMASVPMVFARWRAAVVLAGPCTYVAVELARVFPAHAGPAGSTDYLYWITNYAVTFTVIPAAVYASARLVRVTDELHSARTALAEAAIGRERLRVSRDLHDLLGHGLTAISLKGDLALRLLLRRDRAAALEEINDVTGLAAAMLARLGDVTATGGKVGLATELDNARSLLETAGVRVHIRADPSTVPPPIDEALSWVAREAVTNILRHATASTASIDLESGDGLVCLTILNDGASPAAATDGHGLAGLATRIAELSGTVSCGRPQTDWFLLVAQVPVAAAEEARWSESESSSPKISI